MKAIVGNCVANNMALKEKMFKYCYIRLLIVAISSAVMALTVIGSEKEATNCPSDLRRTTQSINSKRTNDWKNLTPEQKFQKMREWRIKLEQGLGNLKKKREDGTITDEEKCKLERMEQMLKRLDDRLSAVTNTISASDKSANTTTNNPTEGKVYENQKK
ncbi:MAG: hypothetical protein ACPMAG_04475 [Limisphaerales bacterium]